jgi:HAD superfamily hydrolase (TIGR01509 family)
MIRWIFIDVGNVLLNDDHQTYYIHSRYCQAIARHCPGFSFQRFLDEREHEVRLGNRNPSHVVLRRYLSQPEMECVNREITEELRPRYDLMNFPMPYARDMLEDLASSFRLAIIANQMVECRASLKRRGLLDFFDVVALSEELDLHKPDEALFRWALDRAGTPPDQAVMVGDRHDNDIVPAASLGMQSIWIRWTSLRGKGWDPEDPEARAFVDSHEREPFYGRVTQPDVRPTATVTSLEQVAPAIRSIQPQPG